MALYAETGGHVAKRPRVDFHNSAATVAAAAAAGSGTTTNPTALQIAAAGAGILSQQYIEQQLTRRSQEPEKPNHILLSLHSDQLCYAVSNLRTIKLMKVSKTRKNCHH